jgi:hypothetical protein
MSSGEAMSVASEAAERVLNGPFGMVAFLSAALYTEAADRPRRHVEPTLAERCGACPTAGTRGRVLH